MTYFILAILFFVSAFLGVSLLVYRKKKYIPFYFIWFLIYSVFIVFYTGPRDVDLYPAQEDTPYKLPWEAGVSHFVAQGNRSFTSNRDLHEFAWDFVMANGTTILAARAGYIVEVVDVFDGIGLNSNYIGIQHADGFVSIYDHIRKESSLVKVGDFVKQGRPIAVSGMVGQTLFPHLHFYVLDREKNISMPVSFSDVPGGIPFAGHFYTSGNVKITE